MEGYIDLKTLTLDELVGVVNLYPWFGNARKELCSRLADMGDGETAYAAIAEASMYVSSRKALADMMRSREKKDCSDKDIDNILKRYIAGDAGKSGAGDKSGRKVLVVGGDYFSQEQYDRIKQSDGTVFPKFSLKVSGNEGPAGGILYRDTCANLCRAGLSGAGKEDIFKTNFGISGKKCLLCSPYSET